ncbi:MAG: PepSY domain-containing protein [Alphaproteobacteria bacterium]|nr:PepSY domain-containing protein [Alphaproteobacteria bacterium]
MRKWWFSVHKWVGLIVGLQILAWTASGLFMTFFPIEQVRNEHNIREATPGDLHAAGNLIPASQAIAQVTAPVSRAELADLAGKWVWRLESKGKPYALVDATSGSLISPLDEAAARTIATADYSGKGRIVSATLIEKDAPIEYRNTLPVWQLVLDDSEATHLYVAPLTGKVVARRSGLWRTYDFLWSLHIMDYSERENFNHWPIVIMSLLGLALTISGVGILVIRFWPLGGRRHQSLPE